MEWLVPHIARINNFCNTLESGQKTYLHTGRKRGVPYPQHPHRNNNYRYEINGNNNSSNNSNVSSQGDEFAMVDNDSTKENKKQQYNNETSFDNNVHNTRDNSDDEDEDAQNTMRKNGDNEIDLKGQIKRYDEIMKVTKTFPVSVIVSDRSNSSLSNSSSPSPASSLAGSESSRPGDADQGHNKDHGEHGAGRGKMYTYKPAPMVKKSERRFINAEQKDETYWERRKRNNAAAKKSRESRREKEIEVNRRCDLLKKDNEGMKFSIMNLQERNKQLESSLSIYKEILIKNNLI